MTDPMPEFLRAERAAEDALLKCLQAAVEVRATFAECGQDSVPNSLIGLAPSFGDSLIAGAAAALGELKKRR